ncbi:glycosyltransferase [Megasphaera sp. UBA4233]|uniref:glycosyltransferase n=1 Tax=Megasphaera sp. UBA4233 TaxID=1946847 RepID=UPI0025C33B8A|nr:glycosyltransferase [Megasphaera sp. UBA4233]
MFEKLYSIKLPMDMARKELYIKGDSVDIHPEYICLQKGQFIDFSTYFNLFSVKKWKTYTSIQSIKLQLRISGKYKVIVYNVSPIDKTILFTDTCQNDLEKIISLSDCSGNFLIFAIQALEDDVKVWNGAYWGEFEDTQNVDIGIIICTFKREEYVKRNLTILQRLMQENPHFHVMVIDNGQTLPEICNEQLQVIHNRNYGGSGGFTRGLIEQVNQGTNNYVLMMDDDILIETSSLERVYALCQHIKNQYAQQMIAGSMISMDEPTIQYENTAYWGKIRLHALGKKFDLTRMAYLLQNDTIPEVINKYAAWWFCCIPIAVVKKNGYPLPAFIKSDDMEYGIRNRQDIITMNGIGVWHETFNKKENAVVNYFNDRNMLILNHYAFHCGRWSFLGTALGRLGKHILRRNKLGVQMFAVALQDYQSGYEHITSIDADQKLKQIQQYHIDENICWTFIKNLILISQIFWQYRLIHKQYIEFRCKNLKTQQFWENYLHL